MTICAKSSLCEDKDLSLFNSAELSKKHEQGQSKQSRPFEE